MDGIKISRESEITNELYGILRDKIEANWSPTIQEMCIKARAYLKEEYERGRNDGYEAGYVRGQAGTWDDGFDVGMRVAWEIARKTMDLTSDPVKSREIIGDAAPKYAIMTYSPWKVREMFEEYYKKKQNQNYGNTTERGK